MKSTNREIRELALYKVSYMLPITRKREIVLTYEELNAWLRQAWLRDRIISYEKCKRKK